MARISREIVENKQLRLEFRMESAARKSWKSS